jgi:hypothetical protein
VYPLASEYLARPGSDMLDEHNLSCSTSVRRVALARGRYVQATEVAAYPATSFQGLTACELGDEDLG